MIKKLFLKNDSAAPRRLFKYDLLELYVPFRPIRVVICPKTGLYLCTLRGSLGDVLLKSSSADKLIRVARDCYRESTAARLYNNEFYNCLTFIFSKV